MAMRAYLYFTDNVSALNDENTFFERVDGRQREYMDSRHQLPLAWFLFFRPENLIDLSGGKQGLAEVYFVREWEPARREFLARVPLLLSWFPVESFHSDIETFLRTLETLIATPEEKFLVLDASEIQFYDDNVPVVMKHLGDLESSLLTAQEKLEQLDIWACSRFEEEEQKRYLKVFGYYYGGYSES